MAAYLDGAKITPDGQAKSPARAGLFKSSSFVKGLHLASTSAKAAASTGIAAVLGGKIRDQPMGLSIHQRLLQRTIKAL